MIHDDAIVRPVRSKRSPALGPKAILAATDGDVALLSKTLDLPDTSSLYMSRIYHHAGDHRLPAVVGPFMGAPYAVMLLEVLRAWGVREIFFLGWCGSTDQKVRIGDIIIASGAWIDEGTSRHYGQSADRPVAADERLCRLLKNGLARRAAPFHSGLIWTTDAIFRETRAQLDKFRQLGALAVEMELSALLSAAVFYNVPMAAILAVSDEIFACQWRTGFKDAAFRKSRKIAIDLLCDLREF